MTDDMVLLNTVTGMYTISSQLTQTKYTPCDQHLCPSPLLSQLLFQTISFAVVEFLCVCVGGSGVGVTVTCMQVPRGYQDPLEPHWRSWVGTEN